MSALAQYMPDRDFDQENQPLFMVMGGEVHDPRGAEFVDLSAMDIRGVYPTYEDAFQVWRGAAQATVDRAFTKYMIIRLR
jgi:hypothetical protein